MAAPTHNILALSDVHLGADLKDHSEPCEAALDRDLSAFLAHYTTTRVNERPWKLIFAGDLVDFIQVTRVPGGEDAIQPSEDERRYGLHTGEDRAAWKLVQVFHRHDRVIRRLAEFIAAGNCVAVVRGNHDLEFYWPRVQETFKDALADHAGLSPGEERDAFLGRIEFHHWFYLEPGRIYVEHGHVHDEYSTFDYVLEPLAEDDPRLLDLPISSLAMRYFGAKYNDTLDVGEADGWGFFDFVRWAWRVRINPLRIFADYLAMVWRILYPMVVKGGLWGRKAVGVGERIVGQRVEQVKHVLGRFVGGGEGLGRLALALLSAAKPPASRQLLDALQLFFVDRLLLGVGAAALSGAVAAAPMHWGLRGAGIALTVAGAMALNSRLAQRRKIESGPKLREAAARLGPLFGVPFVVMGHSHHPVHGAEVATGTRYFNLGTWHHGPGGTRPRHGLTHLVIEGHSAELRKWEPRLEPAPVPVAVPLPVST